MPITSKTGLLPALKKKNVEREIQVKGAVEMPSLVVPAPFVLKPFAGIYNPFPYGCSILCNHPADFEAKLIVRRAKDAWSAEGKSVIDLEVMSLLRVQEKINQEPRSLTSNEEKDDNVPEELFRRYTETDSRPVTPTPTLASIVTRNLKTRRCMTPDPTSFLPAKEKTLLVLDLRRSHSQETVCWQGGLNEPSFVNEIQQENVSRSDSPSGPSLIQMKKKKTQKKKTGPPSATTSSLKTQSSKDFNSKTQTQHAIVGQSPTKGSVIREETTKNHEISSEESLGELNIVKRRGKKTKKGKKYGKGDKEFQGIPDPGETQVSTLENNSKGSSRESPTEEENVENKSQVNILSRELNIEMEENKSFLSWDTLKNLQRQLDQEVIDSELNIKRKIALEEALKHKKDFKHTQQGEEMRNLKKEFQLIIKDSEKWLSIPRVFTRQSARFELPMDSRLLNGMTPMQYVQQYVFASPERLVLYNHVFNLYKEDPEDDEERSRTILGKDVTEALGKIMGRALTANEAEDFRNLLMWKDEASIDFRTFTGISATCERVMSSRFCSKMSSQKEDPRHEIERADFESLDEKILRLKPDKNLVKILQLVRNV